MSRTIEHLLREHTRARAELARPEPAQEPGTVRCVACAHRCLLRPGRAGICKVRFNEAGALMVPTGYVAGGVALDPIEKKPFFHVLPGSGALSFGMLGCDMHCPYCQNWETSQTLRDGDAGAPIVRTSPGAIVQDALRRGAQVVVSTYNEPLITAEWAADVFDAARRLGFLTGFVSNGNATPEVLDFLRPRLDLYKVDLKGFRDRAYRTLGAVLANVLDGIAMAHARGLWVEIVTLVVPGHNDDESELREIARFIVGISPDIPWHVTAFRPLYRMTDRETTPARTLLRAWEVAREEGLRYVYTGNLHIGGRTEATHCHACDALLVDRQGYRARVVGLAAGRCLACGAAIPGIWQAPPSPES